MRCLAAGYEERWQRRWRCCGGVKVPVAIHAYPDGVHLSGGRRRRLRPVARPVQVPESAQNETASVPAARAQRERVLDHSQRTTGGTGPTQRLQIHGTGAQLQCRHRIQRRRGHRR